MLHFKATARTAAALLLALTLCLGLLPASARAGGSDEFYGEEDPFDGNSFSTSGTCGAQGDNLTWTLDDAGTLTISGTGAMADYDLENSPPWECAVVTVVIEDGVTSIGDYAFFACSALADVAIPASVESVETNAFRYCESLQDVWFGGTQDGWNAVTIGENNEPLTRAALHFGSAPLPSIASAEVSDGTLTVTVKNPAAATGATIFIAFYQGEKMAVLTAETVSAATTYAVSVPKVYDRYKVFLIDPVGNAPIAESYAG